MILLETKQKGVENSDLNLLKQSIFRFDKLVKFMNIVVPQSDDSNLFHVEIFKFQI